MARQATDQVTTIGIDIGKNNFHLIGLVFLTVATVAIPLARQARDAERQRSIA